MPETEEWLADIGLLIDPKDEEKIVDRQGEEALLASEFSGTVLGCMRALKETCARVTDGSGEAWLARREVWLGGGVGSGHWG